MKIKTLNRLLRDELHKSRDIIIDGIYECHKQFALELDSHLGNANGIMFDIKNCPFVDGNNAPIQEIHKLSDKDEGLMYEVTYSDGRKLYANRFGFTNLSCMANETTLYCNPAYKPRVNIHLYKAVRQEFFRAEINEVTDEEEADLKLTFHNGVLKSAEVL